MLGKQNRKGQLNEKLDQIRSTLSALLCDKINVSKQGKTGTSTIQPLTIIPKNQLQQKYCKRWEIQKENNVLIYQLKILTNLVERLQIDEDDEVYRLNEQMCNEEIRLADKLKERDAKIQKLKQQVEALNKEKQEICKRVENQTKKVAILEKKLNQMDRMGGITKFNQLKQQIKEMQSRVHHIDKQKIVLAEDAKRYKEKCKILQQINKETEEKLAEAMVAMSRGQQNRHQDNSNKKQTSKVELLAAKQEIRILKLKIDSLERQKSVQKIRHEEKQSMYSKLVMRNLRS